jgi:hypothetical protein
MEENETKQPEVVVKKKIGRPRKRPLRVPIPGTEVIAIKKELTDTDPKVVEALKGITSGRMRAFALILAQNPSLSFVQAHKEAGYLGTYGTHGQHGMELSRDPKVVKAVMAIREILGNTYKLTAERVLADLAEIIERARKDDDRTSWLKAVELEGKYFGMWKERQLTEDVNETRRLEEKEQEAARAIANVLLRKTG